MKKALIVGALLASAAGAFAQGTVQFTDLGSSFQIHIYAPQAADPTLQVTGNTAGDKPAGTQTAYTGGLVGGSGGTAGTGGLANGNNITVQLYALGGGASAAPASSLVAVPQYTTTVYTIGAGAGLFIKPTIANDTGIPNTGANYSASIALAAWYNGGGTYTSLAAAQAAGVASGESSEIFLTGIGGYVPNGGTPATPPPLTGITSFSLTTSSPEPSTIALGVMGASAFLLRRRSSK